MSSKKFLRRLPGRAEERPLIFDSAKDSTPAGIERKVPAGWSRKFQRTNRLSNDELRLIISLSKLAASAAARPMELYFYNNDCAYAARRLWPAPCRWSDLNVSA
jgi:hypothetical protein